MSPADRERSEYLTSAPDPAEAHRRYLEPLKKFLGNDYHDVEEFYGGMAPTLLAGNEPHGHGFDDQGRLERDNPMRDVSFWGPALTLGPLALAGIGGAAGAAGAIPQGAGMSGAVTPGLIGEAASTLTPAAAAGAGGSAAAAAPAAARAATTGARAATSAAGPAADAAVTAGKGASIFRDPFVIGSLMNMGGNIGAAAFAPGQQEREGFEGDISAPNMLKRSANYADEIRSMLSGMPPIDSGGANLPNDPAGRVPTRRSIAPPAPRAQQANGATSRRTGALALLRSLGTS